MTNSTTSSASDIREALLDTYRSSALSFTTLFLGFAVAVFTELTSFHDYGTSGLYTIPTYALTVATAICALFRGVGWARISREALEMRLKGSFEEDDINVDALAVMHDKFVRHMLVGKTFHVIPNAFIFGSTLGANMEIFASSMIVGGDFLFKYSMTYAVAMVCIGLAAGLGGAYIWRRDMEQNKRKLEETNTASILKC